ncbi:MAG TPA: hypothetical protein VJQ53_05170, partial [Candidatus Eisenbacteria bacterium]|nr:hypothetical protein [Candidatus Eisenbacteria bacterium]
MRRALLPGFLWVLALIATVAAAPAFSAPSSGDGSPPDAAPKFALSAVGIPDSLLRDEGERPFARLWDRAELESLAGRIRDRLLLLGRYDATVQLAIAFGSGTTPGAARISLRPPAHADGAM